MKSFGDSALGTLVGFSIALAVLFGFICVAGYVDGRAEVACYEAGGTWNRENDVRCDIP